MFGVHNSATSWFPVNVVRNQINKCFPPPQMYEKGLSSDHHRSFIVHVAFIRHAVITTVPNHKSPTVPIVPFHQQPIGIANLQSAVNDASVHN